MADSDRGTERVSLRAAGDGRRTMLFDAPKTVRLTLSEGESVPPHRHPDTDIVLHLRSGELDLHLGAETHRLTQGDVIRFDGDRDISPEAVTDSDALLVLA
jgi:quercetin dioxygenase-like cupin family protein